MAWPLPPPRCDEEELFVPGHGVAESPSIILPVQYDSPAHWPAVERIFLTFLLIPPPASPCAPDAVFQVPGWPAPHGYQDETPPAGIRLPIHHHHHRRKPHAIPRTR